MKKATLLKAIFGLALVLVVSSAWGQNLPKTTQSSISTVTNYVEIRQSDGAGGYVAVSGTNTNYGYYDNHVNKVTQNNANATLIIYNPAAAAFADIYTTSSANALAYKLPVIVVPDAIINPDLFAFATGFDVSKLTNQSIWQWSESGDISLENVDDATWPPATSSFTNGTDNTYFAKDYFYQRYVNPGTTIGATTITVKETSVKSDGTLLCEGSSSTITVQVMPEPASSERSGTDYENCFASTDGTIATLALDLVGTPPFNIGYSITRKDWSGGTVTTEYALIETLTESALTAGDSVATVNANSTINMEFVGALTAGTDSVNWVYSIPLSVDVAGTNSYTNELSLVSGKPTEYTVTIHYINDHISRKSDRNESDLTKIDDPTSANWGNHVLYAATSGDITVKLYPTPATGNIFTLPN